VYFDRERELRLWQDAKQDQVFALQTRSDW
jgi:hypothetical protein